MKNDREIMRERMRASKHKGNDWWYFLRQMSVIVFAIFVLTVAARGFGMDQTTTEPNMISMLHDDGAIVRMVVMFAVLIVLLFAVGKPAKRPWWVKFDAIAGLIAFIVIFGLMYWFAWGGGYVP